MNELRTMHLFAGAGGGLLADLILGHKPVVAVEWDAYACQVLRERAADGWFPDLRVWEGDVRLFDPSEYTGKVDCIHAGFPCQDISVAGNQAGVGVETRSGLYREVLRIAGIIRPRYLFLENVAAILGNGLATVLADLAALGMDARWICIRASDVGAPHHRDRWFLLAKQSGFLSHAKHDRNGWRQQQPQSIEEEGNVTNPYDDRCGVGSVQYVNRRDASSEFGVDGEEATVAHSCEIRGQWERGIQTNGCSRSIIGKNNAQDAKASTQMARVQEFSNTQRTGLQGRGSNQQRQCSEQGASDDIGEGGSHLAYTNSERGCSGKSRRQDAEDAWESSRSQEFGYWDIESNVGRVANGVSHRVHRLKALGNAQVPLQAAVAYRFLAGAA